jgi:hypothetical protein
MNWAVPGDAQTAPMDRISYRSISTTLRYRRRLMPFFHNQAISFGIARGSGHHITTSLPKDEPVLKHRPTFPHQHAAPATRRVL